MRGLLLKDWYMIKKYCRSYLFVAIGFMVLSLLSTGNMFFIFYPCLLCGMIPVNLLGYDERSRWMQYSATLPYTKKQIVSSKYLIGLFTQGTFMIVMGIVQGVKMSLNGNFAPSGFAVLMLLMLIMSTFTTSFSLPFIFKLGAEKGRTAYAVMIGVVCAGSLIASNYFQAANLTKVQMNNFLPILCLIGIGIYALSWHLSIVFYKKREL